MKTIRLLMRRRLWLGASFSWLALAAYSFGFEGNPNPLPPSQAQVDCMQRKGPCYVFSCGHNPADLGICEDVKDLRSCPAGQTAIMGQAQRLRNGFVCVDAVVPSDPGYKSSNPEHGSFFIFERTDDQVAYKSVPACSNGCTPSRAQIELIWGDFVCPTRCPGQSSASPGSGSGQHPSSCDPSDKGDGAGCMIKNYSTPKSSGALMPSFSACRKVGTVAPILHDDGDRKGQEVSGWYNCIEWNDGVKGEDGKVHGLYAMGSNGQWASVSHCPDGYAPKKVQNGYLTGSYECAASQAGGGQPDAKQPPSAALRPDGTCPSDYEKVGTGKGFVCSLVRRQSDGNGSSHASASDACTKAKGPGWRQNMRGTCSYDAQAASSLKEKTDSSGSTASSGGDPKSLGGKNRDMSGGIVECKDGPRLYGDEKNPTLENSMCVDHCDVSDMVTLPRGNKAKETCIARVEPKDSSVQDGHVLLDAVAPHNPFIPYKSVERCPSGKVAVYDGKYLKNYVCRRGGGQ